MKEEVDRVRLETKDLSQSDFVQRNPGETFGSKNASDAYHAHSAGASPDQRVHQNEWIDSIPEEGLPHSQNFDNELPSEEERIKPTKCINDVNPDELQGGQTDYFDYAMGEYFFQRPNSTHKY